MDDDTLTDDDRAYQQRLDALPKPGTRVRLTCDVDRYPHFQVIRGSTGTVTEATEEVFSVRIDVPIPGAEDWHNELHWYPRNCDQWPEDEIEVVPKDYWDTLKPRYEDVSVDPAIVEAILNIQMAITRIGPMLGTTWETPELNEAMVELEQAVRWLKGEEQPN